MSTNISKLKITLVKSPIGTQTYHKASVRGLGLKKLHQTVLRDNTPETRGMVTRANFLVKCEEVKDAT